MIADLCHISAFVSTHRTQVASASIAIIAGCYIYRPDPTRTVHRLVVGNKNDHKIIKGAIFEEHIK